MDTQIVHVTVLLCVFAEGTALVIAERSVLRENLDDDRATLEIFQREGLAVERGTHEHGRDRTACVFLARGGRTGCWFCRVGRRFAAAFGVPDAALLADLLALWRVARVAAFLLGRLSWLGGGRGCWCGWSLG